MSSVEKYPDTFFCIVANGNTTNIGSIVTGGGEIQLAQLRAYHKKSGSYSYTMKFILSGSLNGPALIESDVLTFDNATTGQTTSDHLVDLVFTFSNKYELLSGETYYMRIETTGYSRPARPLENTAYLAFVSNWYEPIGGSNSAAAKVVLGVDR